jgi:hypothetical protein
MAVTTGHGRFEGRVIGEWLDDGRRMRLIEPFAYVDPAGERWEAPSRSIVDGASIPRAFWAIVGGPFEGRYRDASVIHDVACVERKQPWEAVHRTFYEACLCGGVEPWRAKTLYAAVYHFGPRWYPGVPFVRGGVVAGPPPETVRAMVDLVRRLDPSLVVIEGLDFSYEPGSS